MQCFRLFTSELRHLRINLFTVLQVLLLTEFSFVSAVRDRSQSETEGSCAAASQIFQYKGLGDSVKIPKSQINAEGLKICKSKKSCCSAEIERKLEKTVKKEFSDIMQASTSHIKNMVGTDTAKFQESFIDMIRLSENNTQAVFAGAYANMVSQTRQPIRDFYSSLVAYIHGRNSVNLESVVRTLFDELFPAFYYTRVDPDVKVHKSSFTECLKSARTKIEPFGEIPKKTSEHITKSFKAAHTLLQALNLGIEVINTTDHSTIDSDCSKQLTKLVYCPHCQLGIVDAKPCNVYCLNVIRGCLSNIAELDQPWNDYITAMSSMTSQMKGTFNIEDAMAHLDERITEGFKIATNLAANIKQQVEVICTQNKQMLSDDSDGSTLLTVESTDFESKPFSNFRRRASRSLSPNIHSKIESFMKSLSKSKGFYASLADTICKDDSFSVQSEETGCWNGHSIGVYNKLQVGIGLEAQKYNPEIDNQHLTDLTIARLKDKLVHIRKSLHSQIVTKPESDSFKVDSGSGGYAVGSFEDDEDFASSIFGSGSGDRGIDFNEYASQGPIPTTPKSTDGKTSGSTSNVHLSTIEKALISLSSILLTLCLLNNDG